MVGLTPAQTLPADLLANARLLPDRLAILPLIPKRSVIAEVGVALGDFSQRLLRVCDPELLIAIDLFDLHAKPGLWGRSTAELFGRGSHADHYRRRFVEPVREGRLRVLQGDSATVLDALEDASLDVAYLDADHGYEAIQRDLQAVQPKVRQAGWIIINDYIMNDAEGSNAPYGVVQATNQFMIANNWEMIYFAFHVYMYCDVVLRRVGGAAVPLLDPHWREQYYAGLEVSNARLEQALAALRASTSWRITGPLRGLRRLLMR